MKKLALAVVVLAAAAGSAKAQDVAAGEQSFRKCLPSHSVGEDARNKIGPILNGIDGRKSGSAEGYNYSEANKKAEITWGEASFKEYIQSPATKVPGTKMAFAGLVKEQDRADVIAYLRTMSDSPAPLP